MKNAEKEIQKIFGPKRSSIKVASLMNTGGLGYQHARKIFRESVDQQKKLASPAMKNHQLRKKVTDESILCSGGNDAVEASLDVH